MARSRIRTRKTSDHFWAPPSFFSRFPPQNLGAYYVPSHSSEVDFCALTVAFDMIHDSASHRVLKIGELTRVIASHLVAISRKSVVNLACSCRYLEEPVLSTLWETQPLLITLLMTLPEDTWAQWENPEHGIEFGIVRDPPPEAWNRVRRYASWMHKVQWSTIGEETFRMLRVHSPAGGWFPALQDLFWVITERNIAHTDLFFSPRLKKVIMNVAGSWGNFGVPRDILPTITSILSALPTSALEHLVIPVDPRGVPWTHFKESFSSIILRCGPSLTRLNSPVPLSDAAVNHLAQLPHLHTWSTGGPPPNFPPSPLPPVFPSLMDLTLRDSAACGWLPLFKRLEHGVVTTQGMTPLSGFKESLRILNIKDPSGYPFDVSFTSPIQIFHNLISLDVRVYCRDDDAQCEFKLNDDDTAKLAIALPQLESLFLGQPCFRNSCATTVICLLSISTHCAKLRYLDIHFNTTNIIDDLKTASEDPRVEALRLRPRCMTLSCLGLSRLPLILDEPGFETVADGMIDIFPSLERCRGVLEGLGWNKLSERIAALREIRTLPTS